MAEKKLTEEQAAFWNKHDYILIPSFFSSDDVRKMVNWVEEIATWPVVEGKYFNYYEMVNNEPRLSRTENFLPYHPEFREFLKSKGLFEIMGEVFNEPAILFKEKINYKYPGTGAYPAHQDVHAHDTSPYAFQPYHRNMTVFLDEANEENGCMKLGWGYEKNKVLGRHPDGAILDGEVEKLDWRPIACPKGSILIFDMYWPHLSEINKSSSPRRTIFMTFNGESKGDLREAHYKDRASKKPNSREIKSDLINQTKLFSAGQ